MLSIARDILTFGPGAAGVPFVPPAARDLLKEVATYLEYYPSRFQPPHMVAIIPAKEKLIIVGNPAIR